MNPKLNTGFSLNLVNQVKTLAVAATATAATIYLLPTSLWPKCPIYFVTGLYCPGCGGLRAAHALLQGDVAAALNQNALIFAIPVLILGGFLVQKKASRVLTTTYLVFVGLVTATFTVLRNIPGSWLAPDPVSF